MASRRSSTGSDVACVRPLPDVSAHAHAHAHVHWPSGREVDTDDGNDHHTVGSYPSESWSLSSSPSLIHLDSSDQLATSAPSRLSAVLQSRARQQQRQADKAAEQAAIPAHVKHHWWSATVPSERGPIAGTAGRLLAVLEIRQCYMSRVLVASTFDLIKDRGRREALEVALLTVHEASGTTHSLLAGLINKEIQETSTPQMILRRNTAVSSILSRYFRVVGNSFLHASLARTLEYILNSPPIEIDRTRASLSDAQLQHNTQELVLVCQGLLDMVTQNWLLCPLSLRQVVYTICQTIEAKYPGHGKGAVGAFVFLRFLCPAILSPHRNGLVDQQPPPEHQRSLLLATKLVQSLVNSSGIDTLLKDESLHLCKEFISENSAVVKAWFGVLCEEPTTEIQAPSLQHVSSLWTCGFCKLVNHADLAVCTRCRTVSGRDNHTPELLSTLETSARLVSSHISKHAEKLQEICQADEAVTDECTFSLVDKLVGAATEFMGIESRWSEHGGAGGDEEARSSAAPTVNEERCFDRFEMALLSANLVTLYHIIDVSTNCIDTAARSAVFVAVSRGCGMALVREYLGRWVAGTESATVFQTFGQPEDPARDPVPGLVTLKHLLMSYAALTLSRQFRGVLQDLLRGALAMQNVQEDLDLVFDSCEGLEANLDGVDKLVSSFLSAVAGCRAAPTSRKLCQMVRSVVDEKFAGEGKAAAQAFSACFLSTVLLHPYEFGLCQGELPLSAQRVLRLVAHLVVGYTTERRFSLEHLERFNVRFEHRQGLMAKYFARMMGTPVQSSRVAQYEVECVLRLPGWDVVRRRALLAIRQLLTLKLPSVAGFLRTVDVPSAPETVTYQPVERLLEVVRTIPLLSPWTSPPQSVCTSPMATPMGTPANTPAGTPAGTPGSLVSGVSEATASLSSKTSMGSRGVAQGSGFGGGGGDGSSGGAGAGGGGTASAAMAAPRPRAKQLEMPP
eukprot:m.134514 g.134514  ORF g.134514 m.134514 type:complete len:963 (+) comp16915_c7_seq2:139-3027(+)